MKNMLKIGKSITKVIPFICLFGIIVVGVNQYKQKKIVSFNMKETINLFFEQIKERNLTENQIGEITKKFNTSLDAAIEDYSSRHNVIIIVSPAIVSGATDITRTIQNNIEKSMSR